MRKTVSGLCPETNSQQMITVTVERIQLGGGLPPSDKVIAYACSHAQEYGCSRNGADGRACPLLHGACLLYTSLGALRFRPANIHQLLGHHPLGGPLLYLALLLPQHTDRFQTHSAHLPTASARAWRALTSRPAASSSRLRTFSRMPCILFAVS